LNIFLFRASIWLLLPWWWLYKCRPLLLALYRWFKCWPFLARWLNKHWPLLLTLHRRFKRWPFLARWLNKHWPFRLAHHRLFNLFMAIAMLWRFRRWSFLARWLNKYRPLLLLLHGGLTVHRFRRDSGRPLSVFPAIVMDASRSSLFLTGFRLWII
jgi:hypothetical protein